MSRIFIGSNDKTRVELDSQYANRHGMVAGATGTGKSVSLMVLAEGFSKLGVPVVLTDVKGDMAGLSQAADTPVSDKLRNRLQTLGLDDWQARANPVIFWDLYGQLGHPIRTSVSEMGPILLGRVLDLSDAQQGVLDITFRLADDNGWLLLDLDDLQALLGFAADNRKTISEQYGLISTASISAVQRAVLRLNDKGGDQFFGEPGLELSDLMRQDMSGNGIINVLAANKLILQPKLYSTFLLWLLSELFEQLPEVGDQDKPRLVFFFDEAHLLFDSCPPTLQQRIEQVVRLIRSKGVGIYFCSQNPDDVSAEVLGQLGNRIQHALRAFTPRDQKAVRAAAETFPPNPDLDVAEVIGQLGVGEALSSTLAEGGVPTPVQRILVTTPTCRLGPISEEERSAVRARSPVGDRYDTPINRESAAEILAKRAEDKAAEEPEKAVQKAADKEQSDWSDAVRDALLGSKRRQGILESVAKSFSRSIGNRLGRKIVRGVLGSIFSGR